MPLPRLLVATTNTGKLKEISHILRDVPVQLETLAGWPRLAAPEETGRTFAENARLKSLYYASATGLPTVAEDSGLQIDALDGAPGVESARFGGPGSSYPEKFALIYAQLAAAGVRESRARFVCALALAEDGRVAFESTGTVEGAIALEPRGSGGFGYDPIFYYPPFGCTMAEAGPRKSEVSHRAAAFLQLRQYLGLKD
jgi:non-canonical purine NTP pyrophosphatase (RdgB/HAM1 family)